MPTESSLWKWLREQDDPRIDQERVENAANKSTPDVEGQFLRSHFHLELKVLHDQNVKSGEETGRIKFEVGQRDWGQRRWAAGGNTYVLAQGFNEDLYLIPGAFLLALPRVGVVKTAFLQSLSWWFCDRKNPEERVRMYGALRKTAAVRHWVDLRLQHDQPLREASRPHAVHPSLSDSE